MRLQFAKNHQNKTMKFWKRVIFSDESPFEEGGSTRKVWISNDEPRPIQPTKKYPIKIQVWGAIGWKSKSKLHFIPQGKRLAATDYQQILKESLLPNIQSISTKPPIFMQDGAKCHTAASTIKWLNNQNIKTLPMWPAQSPDLNPLENIWKLVKDNVDTSNITSDKDLFKVLRCNGMLSIKKTIQNVLSSLPNRINAVIHAEGGNTKY